MAMHLGGGLECFTESVFNFPTLTEAYKHAAYDALGYGRSAVDSVMM
jgi:hypothetical protein